MSVPKLFAMRLLPRQRGSLSANDFNLASAMSHCFETSSKYSFISITGCGLNLNRLCLPSRVPCTMRTRSSTRRCLVTAWRVSFVPSVNSAIEYRCPLHNLESSESRVSSPSAAKIAAFARALLGPLGDIGLNILHLLPPPTVVPEQRLGPPLGGNPVKAGLRYREQSPTRGGLQPELNQRGFFLRVIHFRVDRIGMPGKREERLRLDRLDHDLHPHMLISGMSNLTGHRLAGHKWPFHLDHEPFAELTGGGQRLA